MIFLVFPLALRFGARNQTQPQTEDAMAAKLVSYASSQCGVDATKMAQLTTYGGDVCFFFLIWLFTVACVIFNCFRLTNNLALNSSLVPSRACLEHLAGSSMVSGWVESLCRDTPQVMHLIPLYCIINQVDQPTPDWTLQQWTDFLDPFV